MFSVECVCTGMHLFGGHANVGELVTVNACTVGLTLLLDATATQDFSTQFDEAGQGKCVSFCKIIILVYVLSS